MTTIEKISAGLPSRADWAMSALLVIAKLYRGERVHRYSGAHFDGRKRTLHYTAGIAQAELVLSRAGIATIEGNDAPRGGVLGSYIALPRGNSRIEAQIMELHNELHIKKYGRPAFGGTSV